MIYIDSSLILYAILYAGRLGELARSQIQKIKEGGKAFTSALTFDEVFWKVRKEKGFDAAVVSSEAFLLMPNLSFIDVNSEILWESLTLIKRYKLDPRDAIHAACAITSGINTMVSEDPDFDRVKELKRVWITE
jgi:predicted nucleic acid-binding protein